MGTKHRSSNREPGTNPHLVSLIVRAQRGEQAALAQLLIQDVYPLAYAIARKILFNWADAEDIAQSVVVRVLQRLDSYRTVRGTWHGWVATITRNQAVSLLRRRLRAAVPLVGIDHRSFGAADPAAEAELRDNIAQLERAVGELSLAARTAVRLRYYEDLSLKSIAAREAAPLATIGSRIFRALQTLRTHLRTAA